MNTPKSKKPARFEFKPKTDIPGGSFRGGVTSDFADRVGQLATLWPQVEELMAFIFTALLGITDRGVGRITFRTIVNQKIRIDLMRAALKKAPAHKNTSPDLDDLIDEFTAINGLRNRYVHGLWYTLEEDQRVYLEEETSAYAFLDAREVKIDELDAVLLRMGELSRRLIQQQLSIMKQTVAES